VEAGPEFRRLAGIVHAGAVSLVGAAGCRGDRALLTPAEFRRYVGCEWVETDEALSSESDVLACIRGGDPVLPYRPGTRYVAALDVGTRRDMTALAVAHNESSSAGRRVVVDRVIYWRPRPGIGGRVDLAEVEQTVRRVCASIGRRCGSTAHKPSR
jgi:hypothetical protein